MIDVDVSGTYLILWPSEAEWELPAVMKNVLEVATAQCYT
jgi:hypothetical protein